MVEQRLGVFVEYPFQENNHLCSHKPGSCNPNSPCGRGRGGRGFTHISASLNSPFKSIHQLTKIDAMEKRGVNGTGERLF